MKEMRSFLYQSLAKAWLGEHVRENVYWYDPGPVKLIWPWAHPKKGTQDPGKGKPGFDNSSDALMIKFLKQD